MTAFWLVALLFAGCLSWWIYRQTLTEEESLRELDAYVAERLRQLEDEE